MNARALLRIAVASLLTAACGERVQIGSEEIPSPPPPTPPGDVCVNVPCGQPCAFDLSPCTANECPPSPGGYCDSAGVCSPSMPLCDAPSVSCIGLPCGAPCDPCSAPCDPCDPVEPDCAITGPTMRCDAFEQCQLGKVFCF